MLIFTTVEVGVEIVVKIKNRGSKQSYKCDGMGIEESERF